MMSQPGSQTITIHISVLQPEVIWGHGFQLWVWGPQEQSKTP